MICFSLFFLRATLNETFTAKDIDVFARNTLSETNHPKFTPLSETMILQLIF